MPVPVGRSERRPRRVVVAYAGRDAHDLLRAEAARFHHVRADQIVLSHECPRCGGLDHGRPHLLATAAVRRPGHVSLARAGALSVVAISDAGPIGIDVEAIGAAEFDGFDTVAQHPDEHLAGTSDRTRLWVRKEALLKAYGLGLAVDPRHLVVDEHGLARWDSPHAAPGSSWLRDLDLPGHRAAVAVLAPEDDDLADLPVVVRLPPGI